MHIQRFQMQCFHSLEFRTEHTDIVRKLPESILTKLEKGKLRCTAFHFFYVEFVCGLLWLF